MQKLHAKTCILVLRDNLDIQQLTITYHIYKNLRDLIIPSKLREYEGAENQVKTYFQLADLEHCIEEIDYEGTRRQEILKKRVNCNQKFKKSTNLLTMQIRNLSAIHAQRITNRLTFKLITLTNRVLFLQKRQDRDSCHN